MDVKLSDAEKIFLIHGAEEGIRNDGRSCDDFRPVIVERSVISTTDGSARVRLGLSDLLVGVKCELKEVNDSSLQTKRLFFSVDCSANATPQFAGKGGEEFSTGLVSMLDEAYNNSFVLPDFKRLTVSSNHVWFINIDIVILQWGGSIIDAASIGVKAALSDTHILAVKTRPADEKKMTIELPEAGETWNLDLSRFPLIVTVNKMGQANIVDCTAEEEVCVRAALSVSVCPPIDTKEADDDAILTFTRLSSNGSLERASIQEMCDTAIRVARRLHTALELRIKEEESIESRLPGQTFLE